MENQFFVDSEHLSPEALAKKHRIESDPSSRKNHMEYLPGMEIIESDVCSQVMAQMDAYDYSKYTARDVRAALEHPTCSIEDFKALLSPAAEPFLEQMAERARLETSKHFGNTVYGESQEYSESEIIEATERVMSAYACYIADGANAIKERLNEWTFGDLDEQVKEAVQRYFGLPGVDPYSDAYQKDTAEQLKQNGGAITFSMQEYTEHKEFYDTYEKYGAQILVDEKNGSVMISFASERKWWQK